MQKIITSVLRKNNILEIIFENADFKFAVIIAKFKMI